MARVPLRAVSFHLIQDAGKKERDGARGDKRECVLSADQRRLSLKFLLFTFVPYGANYVQNVPAHTHTHLYFHKTLITLFHFPSSLFFFLALIPSCQCTRASVRALRCLCV